MRQTLCNDSALCNLWNQHAAQAIPAIPGDIWRPQFFSQGALLVNLFEELRGLDLRRFVRVGITDSCGTWSEICGEQRTPGHQLRNGHTGAPNINSLSLNA
jgi:hypothetical protein